MLAQSSYGKSRVRLVHVLRRGDRHDVRDLTVGVRFRGAYDESFTDGDNRAVLPTDTMKNTVYALAARQPVREPEPLALALAEHFLDGNPRLARVGIEVSAAPWSRIRRGEREHGHAFVRSEGGRRTASILASRGRTIVRAGVADLDVLKTSGSAFAGFVRDAYTTLPETQDRLFATSLTAVWRYGRTDVEYGPVWQAVRSMLLAVFAEHRSESVQHTLYAMGQAVLDAVGDVASIRLVMPNRHHLPVDLAPFGLENRNEVFVATEEPHGLIEATLRR